MADNNTGYDYTMVLDGDLKGQGSLENGGTELNRAVPDPVQAKPAAKAAQGKTAKPAAKAAPKKAAKPAPKKADAKNVKTKPAPKAEPKSKAKDKAKELASQHVRNMVTRTNSITGKPYTESTALMAWEIANEPRCFINDSLHRAKFVEWIDEQSTLIKSLDPNHLVTTGSEGKHGCEESLELFNTIHTLPNIDYACIHIWPYNWGWLGEYVQNYDADKTTNGEDPIVSNVGKACDSTLAYIDEAHELMSKAGKPLVLEEFGYPRDGFKFAAGSPTTGRDTYYQYVFNIIKDSGKIAGCNFWGWGGRADVKHTIWERWDDYVCDPAQEEQGLNSVFKADSSTLNIIKNAVERIKGSEK